MKMQSIIAAASGAVVLLASLMPLATNGFISASVSHLGGLTYALYLLPLPLLVVSVLTLHGKLSNPKWWYLSLGLAGLAISLLSISAAKDLVAIFSYKFGRMASNSWAMGAYLLIIGYATTTAAGVFAMPVKSNPHQD